MEQGSYMLLTPGMEVRGADGEDLGFIVEVAADEVADIFRGFVLAPNRASHSVFVPAERLTAVIRSIATVRLTRDDLALLEPASGVAAES
jgi:hypothetical protein